MFIFIFDFLCQFHLSRNFFSLSSSRYVYNLLGCAGFLIHSRMCEGSNPPPYFLTSQRTTLPLQMSPATPTIPPTPPRPTPSRWREPQALAPQPKDRRPSTATRSWWKLETVSQDWQIWTVARVFQGEILWLCRIFFGGMHHIFCLSGCEEHPDHDERRRAEG